MSPEAPPNEKSRVPKSPTRRAEPLRVLLVDDETAIRYVCRLNLEAEGMQIEEAATADAALAVAKRWRPDVAILDVMLPPFDGWELAAQLREAYGDDIGLIFMTAVPVAEAEQRADGFRAAFVPKPFDPLALPVFVKAVAPRRRRSLDS